MNRTGLLVTLLLFSFTTTVMAQKMKVESFIALSQASDPDAKDPTFRKADTQSGRSGQYCAIIKVVTTAQDKRFSFELGSDFVPEAVEYKDNGEIWVYVPAGTNRIKIAHERYGQMDTSDGYYYFSSAKVRRCEAAMVYRLVLATEYSADEDIIKDAYHFATVSFSSVQADATIMLRGVPEHTDASGSLSKQMPLGTFHYRVTAPDYHEHAGVFELKQEGEIVNVNVQLKPAYGWILLDSSFNASGCTYTVDGTAIALSSTQRMKLPSGIHTVVVNKQNHRPQTIDVQIQDSAVFTIFPQMESINGQLSVNTMPGATIKVDGHNIGVAPLSTPYNIVIGNHTVEISCQNYRTETRNVTITEGQITSLSVDLVDMAHFTFRSNPSGARLFVDGEEKGTTPCDLDYGSGNYTVKLVSNKYKTFKKTLHLDSSSPTVNINLQRQYVQHSGGYAMAVVQAGTLIGFGAAVGGYISNINVEASYIMGMDKSEPIYWVSNNDASADPDKSVYKPAIIGARLGYGVILGTKMRITPQVGANVMSLKSSEGTENTDCYVVAGTAGARFEYVLTQGIAVYVAPELSFAMTKSPTYTRVADMSSKVSGWGGFNVRAGISFFF